MAHYDEEMNKRREKREAMRRKQQAEQRRLKIGLISAAVVLVLCGVGIFLIARNTPGSGASSDKAAAATQAAKETKPAVKETQAPDAQSDTVTTIHIKAAGDLNITNSVVESGMTASGYNYTRAFMDVAAVLAEADLTVLNFEGNVCGEPYGTETTSAPAELLEGLRNAGVDLIQTANSCSINNGLIGLSSTLQSIRNAGLAPLGSFATPAEFQKTKGYTICNVDGVKVAFVAFTKGVGGMGMPSGNEDCVNLLYTDYATTYDNIDREGIRALLKAVAAEKPDITVAMLHWGSEYNDVISNTQKNIASLMLKEGVDIIFGTHPHMVQKVEFDETAGTLVAYSLGDFFGDASRGGTNYSIILDVEITKDAAAGTTKVTGFDYTPIYTLTEGEAVDEKRRVVRIHEALEAYNNNYVDKVSKSAFDSMTYALIRIEARVTGADEKKEAD